MSMVSLCSAQKVIPAARLRILRRHGPIFPAEPQAVRLKLLKGFPCDLVDPAGELLPLPRVLDGIRDGIPSVDPLPVLDRVGPLGRDGL